jgi:hypothetical protein
MIKLGAMVTAAVIGVGMCSLPTDASARGGAHFGGGGARMGGAAHFAGGGGGAHFSGGVAHFGGPRVAANVGGWDRGYRGYGVRRYGYGGGYALGGWSDYPAYASCYVWTPLGYVNQCGYDYNYSW